MGSFSLSGGVEVFGFISPSNTTDQYPVIDPLYGIDGLRNVNTLSDLNLIPTLRRRAGMVVGVSGGTTYYKLNLPPWSNTLSDWSIFSSGGSSGGTLSGDYLPLSGGTVTGGTQFTNGLTANTISVTTYQNLPIDIRVTGGTYSNGTATFTNNTGGTFNVLGFFTGSTDVFVTGGTFSGGSIIFTNNTGGTFSVSGLSTSTQFTGGTVSGSTIFTNGLSANTFSATTYQNLPTDIRVTGGTFSNGTLTFTNNTGGTFNVSGISSFDTFVTGFTYSNNTFTISQNSGTSLSTTINSVTGLTINGNLGVTGTTSSSTISATTYQNLPTDVFVTGGTFSGGSLTFRNNTGGTFSVSGISFFDTFVTGFSYNNNTFTIAQNSGSSLSTTINTVTGLTINGNFSVTGTTSSGTISATTYQNLPIDIRVTGGTYDNSIGSATFTNNTGGTFNVSGFFTGYTNVVNSVTTGNGLSGNTTTGDITLINTAPDQVVTLSGGTNISVTGTYPNFNISFTGSTTSTFDYGKTFAISNSFQLT